MTLYVPSMFRVEDRATAPGIRPLAQYDMASRLSYFLWSTMPDEELLSLAAAGVLQKPQLLMAQARRMLKDPRAEALAVNFAGQWLNLRGLQAAAPLPAPLRDSPFSPANDICTFWLTVSASRRLWSWKM